MIQQRNARHMPVSLSLTALGLVVQVPGSQSNFPIWLVVLIVLAIFVLVLFWLPRRQKKDAALEPTQPVIAAVTPKVAAAVVEPTSTVSAAIIAEPEEIVPPVVPVAPSEPVKPDDLKIIEGIGPKIAGLLQEAGIMTFAQLATTEVSRLREILEAAGLARLSDPTTWSEQARLAAAGQWAELETFQDQLKGGRRVS